MFQRSTIMISIVEFCNVFSAITVVSVFCVMVVYILIYRFHIDFRDPMVRFDNPRQKMPVVKAIMDKVFIPFTFKLNDVTKLTLEESSFIISSQVPWILQCFWGVQITQLYEILSLKWNKLHPILNTECIFKGKCITKTEAISQSACTDQVFKVEPPRDVAAEDLGVCPRSVYPMVVLIVRQEESDNPQDVMAMIVIIHIRDDLTKLETNIFFQYLKQASGHVTCLKQLYVEPAEVETPADYDLGGPSGILCVVCRTLKVTRALLPCRHTCVCAACFTKIDKCPMCRGPIQAYFCVSEEESCIPESAEQNVLSELSWQDRIAHWNNRLNEWFGFT